MLNSLLFISYLVLTKLPFHSIEYDEMQIETVEYSISVWFIVDVFIARDISNAENFHVINDCVMDDDDELVMRCRPWPTTAHSKRVDIQIDRLIFVLSVNFKLIAFDCNAKHAYLCSHSTHYRNFSNFRSHEVESD